MPCVLPCGGGDAGVCVLERSSAMTLFAVGVLGANVALAGVYFGKFSRKIGLGLAGGSALVACAAFGAPAPRRETRVVTEELPLDLEWFVFGFRQDQGEKVRELVWAELAPLRRWKEGDLVRLIEVCPNLEKIDLHGYQGEDFPEVMARLAVQPGLKEIAFGEGEGESFANLEHLEEELVADYVSRLVYFHPWWASWFEPAKMIERMPWLRVFDGGECPDEPSVWSALRGCPQLEEMRLPKAHQRLAKELPDLSPELVFYVERLRVFRYSEWAHLEEWQWPLLAERLVGVRALELGEMPGELWQGRLAEVLGQVPLEDPGIALELAEPGSAAARYAQEQLVEFAGEEGWFTEELIEKLKGCPRLRRLQLMWDFDREKLKRLVDEIEPLELEVSMLPEEGVRFLETWYERAGGSLLHHKGAKARKED